MLPHRFVPVMALASALTAGCASQSYSYDPALGRPVAQAMLRDASGKTSGSLSLRARGDDLLGTVSVAYLKPGVHGLHFHETGKCDGPDFATAGGHLNPTNRQHGLENPMGAHVGDLPSLTVSDDGTANLSFTVKGNASQLFDADGAAIIVHEKADDNRTDPSGNSGARLLCGVLTPAVKAR